MNRKNIIKFLRVINIYKPCIANSPQTKVKVEEAL